MSEWNSAELTSCACSCISACDWGLGLGLNMPCYSNTLIPRSVASEFFIFILGPIDFFLNLSGTVTLTFMKDCQALGYQPVTNIHNNDRDKSFKL